MPSDLTPAERDLAIRTIYGEAGGEGPVGQAAVAHVIKNRLDTGSFGNNAASVILAPAQFSVWNHGDPAGALARGLDPNSKPYQYIGDIVDGTMGGAVPDPTKGAVSYYNPHVAAPAWGPKLAQQNDQTIGNHRFVGNVANFGGGAAPAQVAISGAIGAPPDSSLPPSATAFAPTAPLAPGNKAAIALATVPPTEPDDIESMLGAPGGQKGAAPAKKQADPIEQSLGITATADPIEQELSGKTAKPPGWIRDVPADAKTGPKGLMWNASGGYDPKTGELIIGIAPGTDPNSSFASPTPSAGVAGSMGVLSGVPIAGPALQAGAQQAVAGIRSAATGTPYDKNLQAVQSLTGASTEAYPKTALAGNIAGGTAAMLPLGATSLGAKMLGMGSGPMLGRIAASAGSGAAISAADALARGNDPMSSSLMGTVIGAGSPILGRAIGAGANKLAEGVNSILPTNIPGVSRSTANIANKVIAAEGGHNAIAQTLNPYGELGMLADAGPGLSGLARGLASNPETAAAVSGPLTARAVGATDRISGALNDALGPAEDPNIVTAAINARRAELGNQMYPAVHENAPPVDASNVVNTIDNQLRNATGAQRTVLQRVRSELVETPATDATPEILHTDSQRLHNIRMDMDAVINHGAPGLGVEGGAVARTQGGLQQVRNALDGTLKSQVPGMAAADAASAALAQRAQAVQEGYQNAIGGTNVTHPETFAQQIAANDPGTNIALNKGIRGRVDRMFGVGTQRSAVTLNKVLQGADQSAPGYAAQNLATAFGQEPTNYLLGALNREQAFNNTTQEALRQSATNRGAAAAKLLDATQPGSANLIPASGVGLALQGAKSLVVNPIIKMIMENPTAPRNLELARLLTAQGSEQNRLMTALAGLAARQGGVSRAGTTAANLGSGAANRLLPVIGGNTDLSQYQRPR